MKEGEEKAGRERRKRSKLKGDLKDDRKTLHEQELAGGLRDKRVKQVEKEIRREEKQLTCAFDLNPLDGRC